MVENSDTWTEVDAYLERALDLADETLTRTAADAARAGLPDISITATQGKLLQLLTESVGAQSVLEIGTLGGYSTIWLGRGIPEDGKLITLEIDPNHAAVARRNLARAGLGSKCEVRVGPALELLPALEHQPPAPYDLVFIDADKPSIPAYFRWALRLTRPGSLIVVDNVIRRGAVVDGTSTDPAVQGVRQFLELLAAEPRVSATVLQTVGRKGHDGLAVALVVTGQ